MELVVHLVLFVCVAAVIATMSAFYADVDDDQALRSIPRKLVVFVVSCGVVALLMLLLEHTLASVD